MIKSFRDLPIELQLQIARYHSSIHQRTLRKWRRSVQNKVWLLSTSYWEVGFISALPRSVHSLLNKIFYFARNALEVEAICRLDIMHVDDHLHFLLDLEYDDRELVVTLQDILANEQKFEPTMFPVIRCI